MLNIHLSLTAGTLVFLAGILLLLTAVILLIVFAVTAPRQKQKIQERMQQKY